MEDKVSESGKGTAQTSWTKRTEYADGSSVRIEVEKIKNGFLKSTSTSSKNAKGEWSYKDEKEFSETNPLDEDNDGDLDLSLVDKLKKVMNG